MTFNNESYNNNYLWCGDNVMTFLVQLPVLISQVFVVFEFDLNLYKLYGIKKMAARSSNRFRALENVNGSAKEESESSANINTTIEDAVKTAMEEAVASTNGSRTKKAGQKVNVSKSDLAMIGEIVAQVMLGVQPLITSVVTSAVTASTRAILADVAESHTQLRNEVASLQKEVRLHRFQLDRLKQYGRRDSVRIHGLAETAGEPETAEGSTEKVISLAADMRVTLKPDDISISHRLPARAGECRPMIVKFVRRTTKINMMRNKRALRENPSRRGVYVNDDLTQLRGRLV